MFGFTFGLHDGYWSQDHFDGDDIAIDLAASVMFFPGLEARLGYAYESVDNMGYDPVTGFDTDGDLDQFNAWLAWNPGALTLATELDIFSIDPGVADRGKDYVSWMLMANYQFTDWFATTLRYTHEDYEECPAGPGSYIGSWTYNPGFPYDTDHFGLNVEYFQKRDNSNLRSGWLPC